MPGIRHIKFILTAEGCHAHSSAAAFSLLRRCIRYNAAAENRKYIKNPTYNINRTFPNALKTFVLLLFKIKPHILLKRGPAPCLPPYAVCQNVISRLCLSRAAPLTIERTPAAIPTVRIMMPSAIPHAPLFFIARYAFSIQSASLFYTICVIICVDRRL